MTADREPLVSAFDLACQRGGRVVFAGVDFSLAKGEALLVVGPNGSGKSSLIRVLAGLVPAFAGRVDWSAPFLLAGHLDAVKPTLTVRENLAFWVELHGADGDGIEAPVALGLASFGLEGLSNVPARLLSAGQKRRLGLARIAAIPAAVWLLDEPTVSLDKTSVAALERLITTHRAAGGAVIVSTNAPIDLPEAWRLDMTDHPGYALAV